jgi:hypothetical protein
LTGTLRCECETLTQYLHAYAYKYIEMVLETGAFCR